MDSVRPIMREEMINAAVNFLSHPNVRGYPVINKRKFLEERGLTQCEIDEAFRRVPGQPPTTISLAEVAIMNQTNQAGPVSLVSSASATYKTMPYWTRALLAIGGLACLGTGTLCFKTMVIPWLKTWGGKRVAEEDKAHASLVEEAAQAAKSAAHAASVVANAIQELQSAKMEERMQFKALRDMMCSQVKQMEYLSYMIQKLENRMENTQYHATRNGNPWRSQVDHSGLSMPSLLPKNDQLIWRTNDTSESLRANEVMEMNEIEPEPEVNRVSIPPVNEQTMASQEDGEDDEMRLVNSVVETEDSNSNTSHALETEQR